MTLNIVSSFNGVSDPDAAAYIEAVEAADQQLLEFGVGKAINDFVLGCKADGIWDAIKASCILAGARTLNGALQPLAGTAPTPYNFVAGDYNRKTGLVGDGSTKYLDSNRASNSDILNNFHLAVYSSTAATLSTSADAGVNPATGTGGDSLVVNRPGIIVFRCQDEVSSPSFGLVPTTGATGVSRSSSAGYTARFGGQNYQVSQLYASILSSLKYFIFAQNNNGSAASHSDARLAFYSIGESLDLALLDARVTTLINAFSTAIP